MPTVEHANAAIALRVRLCHCSSRRACHCSRNVAECLIQHVPKMPLASCQTPKLACDVCCSRDVFFPPDMPIAVDKRLAKAEAQWWQGVVLSETAHGE